MIQRLRMRYNDVIKPKKDSVIPPKPKTAVVYVATDFLEYQCKVIDFLFEMYKTSGFDAKSIGAARQHAIDVLKVD